LGEFLKREDLIGSASYLMKGEGGLKKRGGLPHFTDLREKEKKKGIEKI